MMIGVRTGLVTLTAVIVFGAGCAGVPRATPLLLSGSSLPIVMATAIIAPQELVNVTRAAVKAEPHQAAVIASMAVRCAPDQAAAIRAEVVRLVPEQAETIVKVTKPVVQWLPRRLALRVPTWEETQAIVDKALR